MKKIIILSVLFLVFLTTNSFALYVEVSNNNGNNLTSNFYFDEGGVFNPNSFSKKTGNFNLEFKEALGEPTYYSTYGFCVDLPVPYGSGDAKIKPIASTNESFKKAAWILKNYWNGFDQLTLNAGIQLAIWKVIYGSDFIPFLSAVSGDKYDVYGDIMSELGQEYSSNFDAAGYVIIDFDDKQDMITVNPVPEPATMALFGLGLLGLSLVGRKRE